MPIKRPPPQSNQPARWWPWALDGLGVSIGFGIVLGAFWLAGNRFIALRLPVYCVTIYANGQPSGEWFAAGYPEWDDRFHGWIFQEAETGRKVGVAGTVSVETAAQRSGRASSGAAAR